MVIDLAPVFEHEGARFAADQAAINASALRAFVWLADDDELTALDWQHTPYRYSPARYAASDPAYWPVPVFPNATTTSISPRDSRGARSAIRGSKA